MIRRALPFLLVLAASPPVQAAERRVALGGFDRVRVNGPFEVTFEPGSPGARVSGDPRVIERVQVRVDGATLTVRMDGRDWGERPVSGAEAPVVVSLASPSLQAASVSAGGRFRASRMKGTRVDLAVTGAGTIAVAEVAADQLSATLIGTGAMTLAGRAAKVRLSTNGPGRIDAARLQADELSVALDGPGETLAAARYAATVNNIGLGAVTVAGRPKCTITARAGGPVRCGD